MKTKICVRFCYGAYEICFKKDFDFPFTPFYGLHVIEEDESIENVIELITHNYQTTTIYYYPNVNKLYVEIRHVWKDPVRDDVIDDIIKTFLWFHWVRTDTTDLSGLKELMNQDNERRILHQKRN